MLNFKFDIIGISETKIMKDSTPIFDIKLQGYKTFNTPTEGEKGGTLLYIADNLNSKHRHDLDSLFYKSYELESTFVEIDNGNKKNIICGCIYRHPKMDLANFNKNYLNPLMDKLSSENKRLYLIGDFNVDLLKIDTNTETSNFLDTLTSNLLVPHITIPTRITRTTKTLIDNIYSNSLNFNEGISGNLTISISDHLAQFLIIPEIYQRLPKSQNIFKRDTKNFNRDNFNRELQAINWDSVIDIDSNDPNRSFNSLEEQLNSLIDKYMPLKKLTKKEIKLKQKPWITKSIRKAIQRREKMYKKFIKAKDVVIKEQYHQKYKELRNEIVKLCRESKLSYYQQYFTENVKNSKKMWLGIKSIINIKNSSKTSPSSLMVDGELSHDPKIIANAFNKYFSSIAIDLQNQIHYNGLDFSKYLNERCNHSFFITPTDKDEILKIITDISIGKACGPHSIPSDILHYIKDSISDPLSEIINLSFKEGIYIDNLEISKTIPVYKNKGSNLICSNYRPISLLSNFNKIVEKLMFSRLSKFLSSNNCIYDLQYGFRSGHSTIHALISLTEDIRNAMDNNLFAVGVFIDLQKAFDTVHHNILLHKMQFYGVRGIANDWFRSYLSNRKQYVSINGYESEQVSIEYGVPQGSVLGPLLFLIYINDLHSAIKFCSVRLFADDTNLLIKNKSLKQIRKYLNLDLRNLANWLKANKISLNAGKTELIIFRHPNKEINYDLKIKIEGKKLIPSKYVKYLGLLIDEHLNWSYHVDLIAPKLNRAIGMLSKIRHYVSEPILRSIYFGIFSSTLNYGSQIFGQFQNKHVNRLIRLQDRAIRIINFAQNYESKNPLYIKTKVVKFTDNVKLLNFLYVYDSINGNLPSSLNYNFKPVHSIHSYNTRGSAQNQLILPKARTQVYGLNSIKYKSTHTWNTMIKKYSKIDFLKESRTFCKKFINKISLENYA